MIPRNEYPRPSMTRENWLCLNGQWEFEIDRGDSGLERGLVESEFSGRITVPFCPESELSGIGDTDYLNAVWYRRIFVVPDRWPAGRVLLHFQAVDYDATVWVNGRQITRHRGGFAPFSVELDNADPGDEFVIVVRARDDHRQYIPKGKQSGEYANHGCLYTRTTGIWQSVWAEPVSIRAYMQRPRITPDVSAGRFVVCTPVRGDRAGLSLRAVLSDESGDICRVEGAIADFQPSLTLDIPDDRIRLWGPGEPNLYDLELELLDESGACIDSVKSYAGLRSIQIDGKAVRINGKSVFQRLVLDQGYYSDGILTAPYDCDLVHDIELSMAAGFNGARLHQKVFEERFLYHADRLGYLVWGEFADWGWPTNRPDVDEATQPGIAWVTQWLEVLARDYSHPCIIGWCPLNESATPLVDQITRYDDTIKAAFLATKAFDQTRPVLDTSGYAHRITESDIWDCHDYQQDPEKFAQNHSGTASGDVFRNDASRRETWDVSYNGQPFFVSEFGGARWAGEAASDDKSEASWGYGNDPRTFEEFYERFEKLCGVLMDNPAMFGYCYTQLTDVFQEQNGLYNFDRSAKFDMKRIAAAQQRRAAIEE